MFSVHSCLFFSSHEHFSPDSTGIRTLNYLSCCTDWVSRYRPGSGRNYRRSGSPNQTTAPPGQRSRFNPQRKQTLEQYSMPPNCKLAKQKSKIQLTNHWCLWKSKQSSMMCPWQHDFFVAKGQILSVRYGDVTVNLELQMQPNRDCIKPA